MAEQEFPDSKQTFTSSEETYKVGYGRPPKDSQFKKGTSGNPDGRPKGSQSLKAQLLQVYTEPILVNEGGKHSLIPTFIAIAKVQCDQALSKDVPAQKEVFKNVQKLGVLDQDLESSVREPEKDDLTDEELSKLSDEELDMIVGAERLKYEIRGRRSKH